MLTGCSGGGKSTLIEALAAAGFRTVPEPGRRVLRAGILPWQAPEAFARACVAMSLADVAALPDSAGPVFLDRCWLDAAIWLEGQGLPAISTPHRIGSAFLLPPWPEIRQLDAERRHPMTEAVAEYRALVAGYPRHGVPTGVMPKAPVADRLDWLLREADC